jgi:hypothetical protein
MQSVFITLYLQIYEIALITSHNELSQHNFFYDAFQLFTVDQW